MLHREFEPPDALRDTVVCFWYNRRDARASEPRFEVLPDGHAEILFHFGDSCSIEADGMLQPLPSPFLLGLLDRPVYFQAAGQLEIVAIRCYPWTVYDLLGLPATKGLRVFEHSLSGLQPLLAAAVRAGDVERAIALVSEQVQELRARVAVDSLLFKAGAALRKAAGTLPVNDVAAAAHATVRTLERRFRQASGHTVKDVSGLIRFEQVRNRLWRFPETNLAGLALELGYADQPHLSREFKRYTGTTPAAFARKAAREQRAASAAFVAFVQA